MFLHVPFLADSGLQQAVFLLNTVVLIAALVVVELGYSEAPPIKRVHLRLFYPLFVVLVGLLIYIAYQQVANQ